MTQAPKEEEPVMLNIVFLIGSILAFLACTLFIRQVFECRPCAICLECIYQLFYYCIVCIIGSCFKCIYYKRNTDRNNPPDDENNHIVVVPPRRVCWVD